MKKVCTNIFALVLLEAAMISTSFAGGEGVVEHRVEFVPPEITVDSFGEATVLMDGVPGSGLPGRPALPVKTIRLALPPSADASTVAVSVAATDLVEMPGEYDVRPAHPAANVGTGKLLWGESRGHIVAGRDTRVYSANGFFPDSFGEMESEVHAARDYRFVTVHLHPVRFDPSRGQLVYATGLKVKVSFTHKVTRESKSGDNRCRGSAQARRLLDNFQDAEAWYGQNCMPPPEDLPAGLAIVTTVELASESVMLEPYIEMREEQGYTVHLATETQWDYPTGWTVLDDRADRIRKWLQDNYEELDIGWVLLIGNPDPSGNAINNIPMKGCASSDSEPNAPTDFYYAGLQGNWDSDDDGDMCESTADSPDWVPEVYVGRLPIYSDGVSAMDEMLARIIEYESDTEDGDISWRKRMLLPNSIYFYQYQYGDPDYKRWDGATVGEWFIRDHLIPRGMNWTTLYEQEGLSPSNFESHFNVDPVNLIDQWNKDYGFVFWTGHGSNTGVYRLIWLEDNGNEYPDGYQELSSPSFMESEYTGMMQEAMPPFVVHGSCSNGYPESADNLGYNLLRRGAIATLSASRMALTWHWPSEEPEMWVKPNSWNGDVIDIVTEYSENLLNGMPAGQALGDAIANTSNSYGVTSWYQKSIQNLYGDPLVRWVMCRQDSDCENQLYCDGEEICQEGICVSAGEPVECEPNDWCDDMICDEETDSCVASSECVEPDAGQQDGGEDTDTETESDEDSGVENEDSIKAVSSCTHFPLANADTNLLSLL